MLQDATLIEICTTNLICYNKGQESKLIDFCLKNGITYLPSSDRRSVFRLSGQSFIEEPLNDIISCLPDAKLFDINTINQFVQGNHDEVLFLVQDSIIKGVVHIVDYNREFVYLESYRLLLRFERMLRELLILLGESNESLIDWMGEQGKSKDYWRKRYSYFMPDDVEKRQALASRRRDLPDFQTFLLSDLLEFVSSMDICSNTLRKARWPIKSLRNWVAHSKDLAFPTPGVVSTDELEDNLYTISELEAFAKSMRCFFKAYEEVCSKLT